MPKKARPVPDLSTLAERAADDALARLSDHRHATGEDIGEGPFPAYARLLTKADACFDPVSEMQDDINEKLPSPELREMVSKMYGAWFAYVNEREQAAYLFGIAVGKRLARLEGGVR
jgi:hypothetical protein